MAVTAHVGPDGDTLGCMLAFKFAFEKACTHIQTVDCVISGKMPDAYRFLPGIRDVQQYENAPNLLESYDVAISVDCGSIDRLGPMRKLLESAKTSINIDHHISNENFAKLNLVEPTAAASGEVVYDLFKTMGIAMDAHIATNLYTAIVSDTGGFKYSNTTPKVMEISAHLITAGADPEYVFKQLYEERPYQQLTMQADAFLKADYNPEKTIGWATITKAFLKQHGALDEHADGLVETIRRVDTVLIAVVFKETSDGNTKVSIRSDTHDINVADVMGKFGGGGHKMAAGCTITKPIEEAKKELLPLLEEQVQKRLLVR